MRVAASQASTQSGPFGSRSADARALADAGGEEPARELARAPLGLAVGERDRVLHDEDARGVAARALLRIRPPAVHSLSGRVM